MKKHFSIILVIIAAILGCVYSYNHIPDLWSPTVAERDALLSLERIRGAIESDTNLMAFSEMVSDSRAKITYASKESRANMKGIACMQRSIDNFDKIKHAWQVNDYLLEADSIKEHAFNDLEEDYYHYWMKTRFNWKEK